MLGNEPGSVLCWLLKVTLLIAEALNDCWRKESGTPEILNVSCKPYNCPVQ